MCAEREKCKVGKGVGSKEWGEESVEKGVGKKKMEGRKEGKV